MSLSKFKKEIKLCDDCQLIGGVYPIIPTFPEEIKVGIMAPKPDGRYIEGAYGIGIDTPRCDMTQGERIVQDILYRLQIPATSVYVSHVQKCNIKNISAIKNCKKFLIRELKLSKRWIVFSLADHCRMVRTCLDGFRGRIVLSRKLIIEKYGDKRIIFSKSPNLLRREDIPKIVRAYWVG